MTLMRLLTLVGLLLPLSACGEDDAEADPPSATAGSSAASSDSPSDSPSTEPTPDPTEDPSPVTPSVTPADGEAVDHLEGFTAHAPGGWELLNRSAIQASYSKGWGIVHFFGTATAGPNNTDELAATALDKFAGDKLKPVRVDDRVVDGVPGYVVTGTVEGTEFFYQWGANHNGQFVILTVSFRTASSDDMAVVDSVLASWKWT